MSKKKIDRPEHIIKVERDWRYGKHARFWEIQKWYERAEGGYWDRACKGGLAYTEWGMRFAIKRKLKKMKIGNSINYFNLNWTHIEPNQ